VSTPDANHTPTQSFFDVNARLVAAATIVDEADKVLLAAVMTIKDLADLLHDPDLNIVRDIEEDFIVDVIIVDVKKCLNSLRNYEGTTRLGVPEAKEKMYEVYKILYDAQLAARDERLQAMKDAIIPCEQLLDSVYGQLQHWKGLADQVRALDAARLEPPAQQEAPDSPPGERPASGSAATDANPPAA
jgi:hypothetical protein